MMVRVPKDKENDFYPEMDEGGFYSPTGISRGFFPFHTEESFKWYEKKEIRTTITNKNGLLIENLEHDNYNILTILEKPQHGLEECLEFANILPITIRTQRMESIKKFREKVVHGNGKPSVLSGIMAGYEFGITTNETYENASGYIEEYPWNHPKHWSKQFLQTFPKVFKRIYLIPDTNFLIRRYGTNLFVPLFEYNKRASALFEFKIPRFVILELERKSGQKSKKRDMQVLLEKRKVLSAFADLFRLYGKNADLLPEIDPLLLQSFSNIAGTGYSDAWIRREVHDFIKKIVKIGNKDKTDERKTKEDAILLTSDLVNAMAAISEGISVCYFLRPKKIEKEYLINTDKLARLIIALSIYYEKISMKVEYGNECHLYEVSGIWPGKEIYEWISDIVRFDKKMKVLP